MLTLNTGQLTHIKGQFCCLAVRTATRRMLDSHMNHTAKSMVTATAELNVTIMYLILWVIGEGFGRRRQMETGR